MMIVVVMMKSMMTVTVILYSSVISLFLLILSLWEWQSREPSAASCALPGDRRGNTQRPRHRVQAAAAPRAAIQRSVSSESRERMARVPALHCGLDFSLEISTLRETGGIVPVSLRLSETAQALTGKCENGEGSSAGGRFFFCFFVL